SASGAAFVPLLHPTTSSERTTSADRRMGRLAVMTSSLSKRTPPRRPCERDAAVFPALTSPSRARAASSAPWSQDPRLPRLRSPSPAPAPLLYLGLGRC